MTRDTVGGLIRWSYPTDENLWPDSTLKRRKASAGKPPAEQPVKVVGKVETRVVTEPEVTIVGQGAQKVFIDGDILPLFVEKEAGK